MGNLLSAGVYRLLRSKVFYVCLAAMFLLEIFFLQGAAGDRTYWNEGLESSYFLYTLLLPLPPRHFADCFSGRNTAAVPFGTNSPLGMVK